MKARLKQEMVDSIKKFSGWTRFPSIYGCGNQLYNKHFLGTFDVKETGYVGVYRIIPGHSTVHLDHVDIIPEYSFKEEILKILEIQ